MKEADVFGKKHRQRAEDLEVRLDAALRKIAQQADDQETHQYNARRAIEGRADAESRLANLRGELTRQRAANKRLHETNAALEKRLAAQPPKLPVQRDTDPDTQAGAA